jgi:putative Mg2+ transporter-C (MgtC) family protein
VAVEAILLRLIMALLLGAAVGAERQWRHHAAGLKTNALVSLGAATFVAFGSAVEGSDSIARVGAQVVTGIGFLGGGIIWREGLTVRGLNTAATLWCSAGIGVLAGAGLAAASLIAAIVVLLGNIGLRWLAARIAALAARHEGGAVRYVVTLNGAAARDGDLRRALLDQLAQAACNPRTLQLSSSLRGAEVEICATLTLPARDDRAIEAVTAGASRLAGAPRISWHVEPSGE